jgi:hypothetical protein
LAFDAIYRCHRDARRIVEAKNQKREVEAFLHDAVEIAIKALS